MPTEEYLLPLHPLIDQPLGFFYVLKLLDVLFNFINPYLVEYPEAREIVYMCVTIISCIQTSYQDLLKYSTMHNIGMLRNLYCCSGFLQQYLTLSRMYSYQYSGHGQNN